MKRIHAVVLSLLAAVGCESAVRAADEPAARKLKVVQWVGGIAHDYNAQSKILAADLPKLLPLDMETVRDGKFLEQPDAAKLDVILMNHCFPKCPGVMTEAQQKKLLEVVREGVGVVALHCSYWSFNEWKDYHDMFGGRFTRHGRGGPISLEVKDREHPITKDLPASFEVVCELYETTPPDKECHVLMVAKRSDPKQGDIVMPNVWTRPFGKGRIVAILPAHDNKSFSKPEYQKLIVNSIRWAAEPAGAGDSKEAGPR